MQQKWITKHNIFNINNNSGTQTQNIIKVKNNEN